MSGEREKIELHAIYTKSGTLKIIDQHGRTIDGVHPGMRSAGDRADRVLVEVTLSADAWPFDVPRAEIKLSVPLEVEERLPDWMAEFLATADAL